MHELDLSMEALKQSKYDVKLSQEKYLELYRPFAKIVLLYESYQQRIEHNRKSELLLSFQDKTIFIKKLHGYTDSYEVYLLTKSGKLFYKTIQQRILSFTVEKTFPKNKLRIDIEVTFVDEKKVQELKDMYFYLKELIQTKQEQFLYEKDQIEAKKDLMKDNLSDIFEAEKSL